MKSLLFATSILMVQEIKTEAHLKLPQMHELKNKIRAFVAKNKSKKKSRFEIETGFFYFYENAYEAISSLFNKFLLKVSFV
jgi:carotenoid cleavage dioxygenase-like enzyme